MCCYVWWFRRKHEPLKKTWLGVYKTSSDHNVDRWYLYTRVIWTLEHLSVATESFWLPYLMLCTLGLPRFCVVLSNVANTSRFVLSRVVSCGNLGKKHEPLNKYFPWCLQNHLQTWFEFEVSLHRSDLEPWASTTSHWFTVNHFSPLDFKNFVWLLVRIF